MYKEPHVDMIELRYDGTRRSGIAWRVFGRPVLGTTLYEAGLNIVLGQQQGLTLLGVEVCEKTDDFDATQHGSHHVQCMPKRRPGLFSLVLANILYMHCQAAATD